MREMRAVTDAYRERVLIGEIYLPIRRLVSYYGAAGDGAHPRAVQLPAHHVALEGTATAAVSEYEGSLPPGAWPNWVLGNHDQPRIASRIGLLQARVAALLLLTLRGTPTLYYGDELGMRDGIILPDQVRDPQGKNIGINRDPARTPMQWSAARNAGFGEGEPWLPLADDYEHCNVAQQAHEPDSMLALYRSLLALRRAASRHSPSAYRLRRAKATCSPSVREQRAAALPRRPQPRPAPEPAPASTRSARAASSSPPIGAAKVARRSARRPARRRRRRRPPRLTPRLAPIPLDSPDLCRLRVAVAGCTSPVARSGSAFGGVARYRRGYRGLPLGSLRVAVGVVADVANVARRVPERRELSAYTLRIHA